MIYLVCKTCSHTQECPPEAWEKALFWWCKCWHCGTYRSFRIVRQIEQPDGSVIEVSA